MGVDPWEAEGARFRVLVEGMADAVAVLDRAAVLQYANPAAEALFGYRLAERRGRDILDLVHPEDMDLVVGSLGEMANIEVPGAPLEVRARAADGSWIHIEVVTTNLLDEPGLGDWPSVPPATCRFCARSADITSSAVMPRSAMRSGSSQTRIEYSREPKSVTSPTPGIRASSSLTLSSA